MAVPAHARDRLEHRCRYLLRSPLALERLTESSHGQRLGKFIQSRREAGNADLDRAITVAVERILDNPIGLRTEEQRRAWENLRESGADLLASPGRPLGDVTRALILGDSDRLRVSLRPFVEPYVRYLRDPDQDLFLRQLPAQEAGFTAVAETYRERTLFGTLSLYRATVPDEPLESLAPEEAVPAKPLRSR